MEFKLMALSTEGRVRSCFSFSFWFFVFVFRFPYFAVPVVYFESASEASDFDIRVLKRMGHNEQLRSNYVHISKTTWNLISVPSPAIALQ